MTTEGEIHGARSYEEIRSDAFGEPTDHRTPSGSTNPRSLDASERRDSNESVFGNTAE